MVVVVVVKLERTYHDVRTILFYVEICGDPSRLPPVASLDAALLGFRFYGKSRLPEWTSG